MNTPVLFCHLIETQCVFCPVSRYPTPASEHSNVGKRRLYPLENGSNDRKRTCAFVWCGVSEPSVSSLSKNGGK